jgi:hypothetical protein
LCFEQKKAADLIESNMAHNKSSIITAQVMKACVNGIIFFQNSPFSIFLEKIGTIKNNGGSVRPMRKLTERLGSDS